MPPPLYISAAQEVAKSYSDDHDHDKWDKGYFRHLWHSVADWFVKFFRGINTETIEHPYFIALALLIVAAWPHLLCLPLWFGKDAYRRAETQVRGVAGAVAQPRRRKRDFFTTRYRAVTNANYEPQPRAEFGGTPLSDGDFSIEPEGSLHIVLRVIRWSAVAWAAFMLGREWYFQLRG